MTYLSAVSKTLFLHVHLKGEPFEETCTEAVARAAARYLMQQTPRYQPLTGFQRYLAMQERKRPRFQRDTAKARRIAANIAKLADMTTVFGDGLRVLSAIKQRQSN